MELDDKTRNRIRKHCEAKDGHLLWVGKGRPRITYKGRTTSVKQLLWVDSGRELVPGESISSICGETLCILPDHCVSSRGKGFGVNRTQLNPESYGWEFMENGGYEDVVDAVRHWAQGRDIGNVGLDDLIQVVLINLASHPERSLQWRDDMRGKYSKLHYEAFWQAGKSYKTLASPMKDITVLNFDYYEKES